MTMNKLKCASLVLGFASIFAVTSVSFAETEKDGIVRGSYVNLRQEPKFNSPLIGKKLRGDTYSVVFEQQNWLKVKFKDGLEGWIYKTLIESGNLPPDDEKTTNASTTVEVKKAETSNESKDEKSEKKSDDKPLIKPTKKADIPEVVEISGTAEELYNEAIKLYAKRRYAEALEKNQQALKKAPKNAEILNNLGNCQFKLGRIEEALSSWQSALKIAPRSGKICNNVGIAYYQLDKNNDAIEYYKKAIMFEPEFSDAYYNLASVQGYTGEFQEAINNYKKFLELNPDDTMKHLAEERLKYCEKHLNK